jgi:hypothetical protein
MQVRQVSLFELVRHVATLSGDFVASPSRLGASGFETLGDQTFEPLGEFGA